MSIREFNRALATLSMARSDWDEAKHYFDGSKQRERRIKKRIAKRAMRRLDRVLSTEELSSCLGTRTVRTGTSVG